MQENKVDSFNPTLIPAEKECLVIESDPRSFLRNTKFGSTVFSFLNYSISHNFKFSNKMNYFFNNYYFI